MIDQLIAKPGVENINDATKEHIGIDEFDIAKQSVVSHHYWMESGVVEMFQFMHRYAWLTEYDLMGSHCWNGVI